MSDFLPLTLMAIGWGAVIALGAVLGFYCLRSYRRSHARPMALLGVGFVLLSAGTATAWTVAYLSFYTVEAVSVGCTIALAAGFGVILYALRTRFV